MTEKGGENKKREEKKRAGGGWVFGVRVAWVKRRAGPEKKNARST